MTAVDLLFIPHESLLYILKTIPYDIQYVLFYK